MKPETKQPRNVEYQGDTHASAISTDVAAPANGLDISRLRLPSNFGSTLGVEKLLTTVHVGKPKQGTFFRVHSAADMTFDAMLLVMKERQETYLVEPAVAQQISDLAKPFTLFMGIDRQNNLGLIPVPLPGEDGLRNPWHESLLQALLLAQNKWIRLAANMSVGAYDVFQAEGNLAEPEWPAHTLSKILEVGFRGRIISNLDHPIVQSLLGRV